MNDDDHLHATDTGNRSATIDFDAIVVDMAGSRLHARPRSNFRYSASMDKRYERLNRRYLWQLIVNVVQSCSQCRSLTKRAGPYQNNPMRCNSPQLAHRHQLQRSAVIIIVPHDRDHVDNRCAFYRIFPERMLSKIRSPANGTQRVCSSDY